METTCASTRYEPEHLRDLYRWRGTSCSGCACLTRARNNPGDNDAAPPSARRLANGSARKWQSAISRRARIAVKEAESVSWAFAVGKSVRACIEFSIPGTVGGVALNMVPEGRRKGSGMHDSNAGDLHLSPHSPCIRALPCTPENSTVLQKSEAHEGAAVLTCTSVSRVLGAWMWPARQGDRSMESKP